VNPSDAGSASATTAQNCPGGYAGGTVVSVSALPSNGFQFSTWSATNCLLANGSQASTTCTITGDGNALVTANFTTNPPTCYALTTTVSTGDGGSATATTPQNCSGGYTSGTAVTISASANNGFTFSGWTAANCNLANAGSASTTCTVTGVGNAIVTANFAANQPTCYALTTAVSPGGAGSATATTPKNCSGGYTSGTAVAISALPNNGYTFSSWSPTNCTLANAGSTSTTCTVTGAGNASVTANFTANQPTCFTFSTSVSPGGAGTANVNTSQNCSGGYASGTAVAIFASANSGYTFSRWTPTNCTLASSGSASTTCTVTGAGNASVTANFTAVASACYTLTPNANPAGSGIASGASNLNCVGGYTSGTAVAIVASPNSGYQFSSWSATNCTLANAALASTTCTITGTGDATVTANFTAVASACYTLTPNANPAGSGIASGASNLNCVGGYTSGTAVAIVASPNSGYQFSSWSATNCTLANSALASTTCTITGAGNATVTANFTTNPKVYSQQGSKLVASGAVGFPLQGASVSVSADGNTAIVGGWGDNNQTGAAWVWTKSGGVWNQQGPKLVGSGAAGPAAQGLSVSISADGNTAIIGGSKDNGGLGAAWIWTRSGGIWTQMGTKLIGAGAVGSAEQGTSVSLSADGNTAIVGAYLDNNQTGAAWIWTRSGGGWNQQGPKLVGTGAVGSAIQGYSVSLSADGNTAIVGGSSDNNVVGAAWVWTRSGGVWNQQGPKLVGYDALGIARQGQSVSLSADGNTAIVGGRADNSYLGAVWVWTRNGGLWSQQGPKLVGSGAVGAAEQGFSLSLSGDGNTAIVGGVDDNGSVGAAWIWSRSGGVWSQQGNKLVGAGAIGNTWQGISVSITGDGNEAIVGGYQDNNSVGAVWVFSVASSPSRRHAARH